MTYLILIIITILFAVLLGFMAKKRKANVFYWTVMGALFGPFAIPFVFFAKTEQRRPE